MVDYQKLQLRFCDKKNKYFLISLLLPYYIIFILLKNAGTRFYRFYNTLLPLKESNEALIHLYYNCIFILAVAKKLDTYNVESIHLKVQ